MSGRKGNIHETEKFQNEKCNTENFSVLVDMQSWFMMDKANTHQFQPSWPTGVFVILVWLMMASPLMAEIQDLRKEIVQESERYRAKHFPDGRMPPKHDWRKQRPLRWGETTPPEAPGGVGYGYYFYDNALLWTNSTVADYYVVVPTLLNEKVSYLYLTSTCRAQLGTESLIEFNGPNEAAFWIYDWAQAAANRWQLFMNLPNDHPEYLTQRPDEFAVTRQMIHVRNGTYYLGFANGQYQWQNQVMLFNFTLGDWDLIYSYNYGTTNLTDNLYGNDGDPTGYWGPIVETFGTFTNVNSVGFDLIRLFQDGNPNAFWLSPTNSYAVMSSPWQLLTEAPNTSFTAAVNSTNLGGAYSMGTLCVTTSTNAASFSLSPPAGIVSSNWVITPMSNGWDKIVVGLPPGAYSITFNPVPGLASPAQQSFAIATNSITMVQAVYYVPAPVFQSVTTASGSIIFSWSATTGFVYQLQYKTNLNEANWVNLGGTITASNTVLSATDAIGSDEQRFYRVQQQ